VIEDGLGGYVIDTDANSVPAIWSPMGDAEGITQADLSAPVVYVMIEESELIRSFDVSVNGSPVLLNEWDVSDVLPGSGNPGAEGITFVPDSFLADQGFVDAAGDAYVSVGGMGGLMLLSHEATGEIFFFDLNETDGSAIHVGTYASSASAAEGLEFDRSTGTLLIWHGSSLNQLEITWLSSLFISGTRRLEPIVVYNRSIAGGIDGVAVESAIDDCSANGRGLFLAIDGGGALSMVRFTSFPCTF